MGGEMLQAIRCMAGKSCHNVSGTAMRHRAMLRELVAAKQGVALVETALIAPIFVILILGVADLALYGAALIKAQQAVNRGLEMAMMGGTTVTSTSIQSETASQADVSTSNVTVTQTLECSGTATTWNTSCATGQETAAYVQIQLSTSYQPLFALSPLSWVKTDSSGKLPISLAEVIRIQ